MSSTLTSDVIFSGFLAPLDTTCTASTSPDQILAAGLFEPVAEFLSRPGKRIRADLIQFAFEVAGGNDSAPSELFEFLELLHAGSLILDDIEDDSEVRRGRPALHRIYGVPLAVNAGNWMYFSALEKLQGLGLPNDTLSHVMGLSISVIRQCHEGQAIDLAARIDQLPHSEIGDVALEITTLKTGRLTSLAAQLGALAAGADRQSCESISEFGLRLGIGLQMHNDLSELMSGPEPGGRLDDLIHGRVTWPWAWTAAVCNETVFSDLQNRWQSADDHSLGQLAAELIELGAHHGRLSIQKQIRLASALLESRFGIETSDRLAGIIERLGQTNA